LYYIPSVGAVCVEYPSRRRRIRLKEVTSGCSCPEGTGGRWFLQSVSTTVQINYPGPLRTIVVPITPFPFQACSYSTFFYLSIHPSSQFRRFAAVLRLLRILYFNAAIGVWLFWRVLIVWIEKLGCMVVLLTIVYLFVPRITITLVKFFHALARVLDRARYRRHADSDYEHQYQPC
jgi:hypothetical protein